MKRIVIVCRGCGEGGSVARIALRQAQELARTFEVVVISDSFGAEVTPFGRVRARLGAYRALGRLAHVPRELSFARAARQALRRLHQEAPVRFVLTHSHVVASMAALPLRERFGIPFGLVVHGDVFDRPRGAYDPLVTALYKHATPRAYRTSDLVVALSPHIAEVAKSHGGDDARVRVLPYGVDVTELGLSGPPKPLHRASGPLRLLYVGRLALEKGVDTLLDACVIAASRNVDFTLDVVGHGPRAAELTSRAAALGGRVRFIGQRRRSELGSLYVGADVLCTASVSESLPGVVLEALACGTPVIASDIGPHRFLVKHAENGFLVETSSAVAMADAIETLGHDRALLHQLSDAAVSSVERFEWTAIGRDLASLIAGIA
jgi:glycosyltransferase involved in cell wall biosynthesis